MMIRGPPGPRIVTYCVTYWYGGEHLDTFNEKLGLRVPEHVAVILDGNGRWAKKRLMPRTYGHYQGSKVVEDMLHVVDDMGVKYFTVYAFLSLIHI